MSGIAVVVRRSGERVPTAMIDRIGQSLRHRAPDGVQVAARDNVAVILGRLHATPEACFERQPHECGDGAWLVADVRIDNRSELMTRLRWRRPAAESSDVELLAGEYERAGERVAAGVLGDFAMVALHPDGRIVCFRDHLGVKPLYYWVTDEWVVVSSELRQIAAHPDSPRVPDVGLLGEYLSGSVESTSATVISGIRRLPAAHGLVIDGGGERTWRYWTPPFDDRIEFDDPAEYEEELQALFADAVRCRLRACGPVAAELSGGLDSTSVTGMAAQLVRSGEVPARDVLAFSCLVPWSAQANEDGYISDAVRQFGVDWTGIENDPDRRPWVWEDAEFWSDIPLSPDGPDSVELCRSARSKDCAVVLTGQGGDHWFDPSWSMLLELVEDMQFAEAWRTACGFAGSGGLSALWYLIRYGMAPHRPSWLPRPGARKRAPGVVGAPRVAAKLDRRRVPGRLPRTFRRLRAHQHFEQYAGGPEAMYFEILDRIAARAGVEYRHPYFDRRLVEFGCRVPTTVHGDSLVNRRLQRQALHDVLPTSVAARDGKADFSELWLREYERHLPEAHLADTRLCGQGWIDGRWAHDALCSTRAEVSSGSGGGQIFSLWGMVQAEAVLGALAGDAPLLGSTE